MPDPFPADLAKEDPIVNTIGSVPFCVCVPARNEEARLGILLGALAEQDVGCIVPVAISLNNTSDGSEAVIEAAAGRWRDRLRIRMERVTFPTELAHAGSARHHAMALGARVLEQRPEAVLISTDADSRPPPEWVRASLVALARGADLVGGRLEIDPLDGLSASMAEARALWDAYWVRVREIEDAIDPIDWDPAPRHGDHTGASLALRVLTLNDVGGVPILPVGEDRALVAAALAGGARLRHPPEVWTRVSGRTEGRAPGGMADHLAAMSESVSAGRPAMVPSLDQWRERAAWRRERRGAGGICPSLIEAEARLPPMVPDMPLADLLEAA